MVGPDPAERVDEFLRLLEVAPNRWEHLLVEEVVVGLATNTTVYLSRRGDALKVNKLTFTIRTSDSSWHPGLPGRPHFVYKALRFLKVAPH